MIKVIVSDQIGIQHFEIVKKTGDMKSGTLKLEHVETRVVHGDEYTYALIDLIEWDKVWIKKDYAGYIPPFLPDIMENKILLDPFAALTSSVDSLETLRNAMSFQNKYIYAPHIDLVEERISDGRHRYFIMREMGLRYFIAAVLTSHLKIGASFGNTYPYIKKLSNKVFGAD